MKDPVQLLQAFYQGEIRRLEVGQRTGNRALYTLGEPEYLIDGVSYSELRPLARNRWIDLPMVGPTVHHGRRAASHVDRDCLANC